MIDLKELTQRLILIVVSLLLVGVLIGRLTGQKVKVVETPIIKYDDDRVRYHNLGNGQRIQNHYPENGVYDPAAYRKAYIDGYTNSYCYGDPNCVGPVEPIVPPPEPGFESAKDGYIRGVRQATIDKVNDD